MRVDFHEISVQHRGGPSTTDTRPSDESTHENRREVIFANDSLVLRRENRARATRDGPGERVGFLPSTYNVLLDPVARITVFRVPTRRIRLAETTARQKRIRRIVSRAHVLLNS